MSSSIEADESIAPVPLPEDVFTEKKAARITDEAGELAVVALASGDPDVELSRKVLRKIDLYLLPFLCVTYGLQFLDKTSLAYSSVFGVIQDTHLVDQDYSWASSIFYFGYLIAEYPGVALLQRFPIAKFLGINIIIWAAILMLTATASSFASLATLRFLLGIFESTISPGFVILTSTWYTRQEQASRSSLWISFMGLFGTIGGILTFGIGHINHSLSPWKLIYLILGAVTILWGILFLIFVPDNPATTSWLTEEERIVALQRVIENKTGTKSRAFVKSQAWEAITDPKILLLGLISFVNAVVSGGLSFGSLIIQGFGYTALQTALMNMPLSFLQSVFMLLAGYTMHKLSNSRLYVATVAMILPIIGTLLINQLATENKWGRLVGLWLLASYPTGFMVLLSLLASNIAGTTKKSTASALVFIMYCAGQIVGPQCFKASEKPGYRGGIISMLVGFTLNAFFNLILRALYVWENKRREKELQGLGGERLEDLKEESRRQGFEDRTDKENVFFRYVL
ncbi:hypothetical protein HYALB_00012817 [Hymenoscyphus albidus]|uniref:Major facilitator superfamily (MFS) profile domain-containing protein n=1 Tax=Hymenoscyphus albidus TaxID=595503 RepID=A0A9N9LST9_9HELO|nr:hypothetical protein HYALB_00012817 [Hymenoscyphus albidus]